MTFFNLNPRRVANPVTEADFFVTYALKNPVTEDSLSHLNQEYETELLQLQEDFSSGNQLVKSNFLRFDHAIGLKSTESWLNQPGIAEVIRSTLKEYEGSLYEIVSYTIMNDHMHLMLRLIKTKADDLVTQWLITTTLLKDQLSHHLQPLTGIEGAMWQEECFDLRLQDDDEMTNLLSYMMLDPVKNGLALHWKEYPYSYINPDLL